MSNPLQLASTWNLVSEGYGKTASMFLRSFSQHVFADLPIEKKHRVVDVACGPGTASLSIHSRVNQIDALDFSSSMLRHFNETITQRRINNIELFEGDGQSLPFQDNVYDLYISMFGLMFFPDREKGLKEAYRVLKPGGKAIISSWAPMEDSPLMQLMMEAMLSANPNNRPPSRAPDAWDRTETITASALSTGFIVNDIKPIAIELDVDSADDFWFSFIKGSPQTVIMKQKQPEEHWQRTEETALGYLREKITAPTSLSSLALISVLEKPFP